MIKNILSRNIVLYLLLALALNFSVDWKKCFDQRGRYLLGIFYNGFFQNSMDGAIYTDYLKRHGTDRGAFEKNIF